MMTVNSSVKSALFLAKIVSLMLENAHHAYLSQVHLLLMNKIPGAIKHAHQKLTLSSHPRLVNHASVHVLNAVHLRDA